MFNRVVFCGLAVGSFFASACTPEETPPDAGGSCVVDLGEQCGGAAKTACTCASGLSCQGSDGATAGPGGGSCALPPDSSACSGDSDCKGPLPQLCKICGDGTTACAHWTCVAGECMTATCSN